VGGRAGDLHSSAQVPRLSDTAAPRLLKKMLAMKKILNESLGRASGPRGDLGVTMVRGMRAILGVADAFPDDLGVALLKCAQGFTKTIEAPG
jgi:hypothetical protein